MQKTIKIYDTKIKQKVDFTPIKQGKARIYVCGPTVYDDAHLGHARSSIAFDLLRRALMLSGHEVIFVKNFTDIDDKIIKKAHDKGVSIEEITKHYTKAYMDDMQALEVLAPDIAPKATQNLGEIAQMIEALLEKGAAYRLDNGDVYLNVPKDSLYGSISARGVDDENLARIENDAHKKDARDFALWKHYKGADDVGYESALGRGRPGWHIECSAMIEKVLAYKDEEFAIDIHGGGADLLFPHHENEASQTRCATGRELSKYWMHNGFVNINGEKMSKSLGNSFFIKDALKHYSGEVLRNYLLGVHYRAVLHFSEEDLLGAKKRLDKIYRLKKRIASGFGNGIAGAREWAESNGMAGVSGGANVGKGGMDSGVVDSSVSAGRGGADFGAVDSGGVKGIVDSSKGGADSAFCDALLEAMSDDLNISKALSVLEDMLTHANAALDSAPKDKALKARLLFNLDFVYSLLGIGGGDEVAYFQQGVSEDERAEIESKLLARADAKKEKNFALADSIRDELSARGILISDTPSGSTWEKVE